MMDYKNINNFTFGQFIMILGLGGILFFLLILSFNLILNERLKNSIFFILLFVFFLMFFIVYLKIINIIRPSFEINEDFVKVKRYKNQSFSWTDFTHIDVADKKFIGTYYSLDVKSVIFYNKEEEVEFISIEYNSVKNFNLFLKSIKQNALSNNIFLGKNFTKLYNSSVG